MERLLEQSKHIEEQCIAEIMALESITHRSLKCTPQPTQKTNPKQ